MGVALLVMALTGRAAAAEGQAGQAPGAQLLVWSSSATAAEARQRIGEVRSLTRSIASWLRITPTLHRGVAAPGGAPEAHLVVLGLCSDKEMPPVLQVLRALNPALTLLPAVKAGPLARVSCPTWAKAERAETQPWEDARWTIVHAKRVPVGDALLVGLGFSYHYEQDADFGQAFYESAGAFLLLDPERRLLGVARLGSPSTASHWERFEATEDGLDFRLHYADPRCEPTGDRFVSWSRHGTVTVAGGKPRLVLARRQRVSAGRCGYAEESEMMTGGQHQE